MTMKTTNDQLRDLRRSIAECVLRGHRLRNEMDQLTKEIGNNANIADLNVAVSAMAEREKNHQLHQWNLLMAEFQVNEFEKMNARVDLLRLKLKIQMS